jgi:hypothetical protein
MRKHIRRPTSDSQTRFDARDYRRALGQYPTGVTVITTRGPDGRRIGITANSFTSVSLAPPLVCWSLSKKASHFSELENAASFAVNVLAAGQHHLSRQFATSGQDKFEGVGVLSCTLPRTMSTRWHAWPTPSCDDYGASANSCMKPPPDPYQPRARHSSRWGRSAPSVVSPP